MPTPDENTSISQKAVDLATTAHEIEIYQGIVEVLETQLQYFRGKVTSAQDSLRMKHNTLFGGDATTQVPPDVQVPQELIQRRIITRQGG